MYAKKVTKEYLQRLGITYVTKDGKVFKRGEEIAGTQTREGYLMITLYDPDIFAAIYPITKSACAGNVNFCIHRIVYAWFHGETPDGLVIDHIDDDKSNNSLDNLRAITPGDNIWKGREHNVSQLKCRKGRPRSYYEAKLEKYTEMYELAKLNHDAEGAHRARSCMAAQRAYLRYWDSHNEQ